MTEIKGNIWNYHSKGWVVITTNGFVKNNGCCVMGRGTANDAARRFPDLPLQLGRKITEEGNIVHSFSAERIITFPVKHNWWEDADLKLIERSINQLNDIFIPDQKIYLPRPGCGNGHLKWAEVKPLVSRLSDRFTVVDFNG